MVSAHNVTTKKDFVLPLQYVSEGDTVTTPSNFGAAVTTPTYTAAGRVMDITLNPDIPDAPVSVLGSEDIVDSIKNEELYSFLVRSHISNTTLLKYGVNLANGVGTIDESLTFKFSKILDGSEVFTQMVGARPSNTSLTLDRAAWLMEQTWICKSITVDSGTDPDTGATNVTTIPTTTVWRHQDTGATPFTWNAVNFGERRFNLNVTRDLAIMKVNGSSQITFTKPSNRTIEFSADVIRKNTSLFTDFRDKTKRAASYEINDGTAQINFTDAVITAWSEAHTATDFDILMEPITARAETVTVVDT